MTFDDRSPVFNNIKLKTCQIPKLFFDAELSKEVVGIDLGTSRCSVAVQRRYGMETVGIENDGGRMMPSFVSFDEEIPKCGQIVLNRLCNKAASSVFDVKRIIGKQYQYIVKDSLWPFEVCEQNGTVFIQTQNQNGIIKKSPEEVSAVLLKTLKKKAEDFQGKELTTVTITVPSTFTAPQCEATINAAKLAGWKVVNLFPEPMAAALAYIMKERIPKNSKVLLIDLGGGTLDVSIFSIVGDVIKILGRAGDECLGGRNFDNQLFNYLSAILENQYRVNLRTNKAKYRLMADCLDIKHTLSAENEATLDVTDYIPAIDGILKITRNTFENITEHLLRNIKVAITKAMEKSNFANNEIEMVIHVGGGCRMPMVKGCLQTLFPNAEHCFEENPDEVVAIGAAYYATSASNAKAKENKIIFSNVRTRLKKVGEMPINTALKRIQAYIDNNKRVLLFAVAIILTFINFPITIISLFHNSWIEYENNKNQTMSYGLISGCSSKNEFANNNLGTNFSCSAAEDIPGWFKACQGMIISSATIHIFTIIFEILLLIKSYYIRILVLIFILIVLNSIIVTTAICLTWGMAGQWKPFPNFLYKNYQQGPLFIYFLILCSESYFFEIWSIIVGIYFVFFFVERFKKSRKQTLSG